MSALPVLKPREYAAVLEHLGFVEVRQRGSHRHYRHPDGRNAILPFHQGRDLSPVLLQRMTRDSGVSSAQVLAHL